MSGIQTIREGLTGNVTRVIVVAIIITFIGSVGWAGFFSQGNVNVVATVGSKEITNADLNFEVSTQQFALSQRFPDQEIDDETLFTLSKNNLINKFSVLDFLDSKKTILTDEFIIDIKTTTKVHDFKWKCNTYNYDSQAYIYQRLFNRQMIFFVIDKDTLQLKICDCSPEFLERGKEKVEKATHEYNSFYGENKTKDPENFVIQETL